MIKLESYQKFVNSVADEITGDWLIIGGSLLAILGAHQRVTADIDICPIGNMNNDLQLELMNLAIKCGLSIEAINPAADFFVKKIPNWKSSIVLFKKGQKGAIYRPSLELYFKLKLARCSESDLEDCLSFLSWYKKNNLAFDKLRIKTLTLDKHLEKPSKKLLEIIEDLAN